MHSKQSIASLCLVGSLLGGCASLGDEINMMARNREEANMNRFFGMRTQSYQQIVPGIPSTWHQVNTQYLNGSTVYKTYVPQDQNSWSWTEGMGTIYSPSLSIYDYVDQVHQEIKSHCPSTDWRILSKSNQAITYQSTSIKCASEDQYTAGKIMNTKDGIVGIIYYAEPNKVTTARRNSMTRRIMGTRIK